MISAWKNGCQISPRGRCNFVNLIAAAPELVASVLPAGVRAAPLDTLPQAGFQPLVLPAAHCALTTQSTGKLPLPALDTMLLASSSNHLPAPYHLRHLTARVTSPENAREGGLRRVRVYARVKARPPESRYVTTV